MKKLILLALLATTQAYPCTIVLLKTKPDAKTFYTTAGASISKSVIAKLSPACTFKTKVMTTKEHHAFKVMRLEKRLKKLLASKI